MCIIPPMTKEVPVSKTETIIVTRIFFFFLACLFYTYKTIQSLYLASVWNFTNKDIENIGSFMILCFLISPLITKLVTKYHLQKAYIIIAITLYSTIVASFFTLQSTFISKSPYNIPFITTSIIIYECLMGSVFSIIEIYMADKIKEVTAEESFKNTYSVQRAFIPIGRVVCSLSYGIFTKGISKPEVKYSAVLIYVMFGWAVVCSLTYFSIDTSKNKDSKTITVSNDVDIKIDTKTTSIQRQITLVEYIICLFICGTIGAILSNRTPLLLKKYFLFEDLTIIIYSCVATGVEIIGQFFLSNFIFSFSNSNKILVLFLIFSTRILILATTPSENHVLKYSLIGLEESLRGVSTSTLSMTFFTISIKYGSNGNTAFLYNLLNSMVSYFCNTAGSILGSITTVRIDKEDIRNRSSYYIFFFVGIGSMICFSIVRLLHRLYGYDTTIKSVT
eukprot:GHVP01043720.1.p1 GENE.GHVP01043720.1~~GHVP01043720.1.p1  ORF type:complete len:448 (-),score=29.70 GHVP01043720.1:598-1941(-)